MAENKELALRSVEGEVVSAEGSIPDYPIPPIPPERASAEDVLPHELRQIQYIYTRYAEAWREARGIDAIGKMGVLSMRLMKENRDILGIPYGSKNTEKKLTYFEPIE